MQHTGMYVVELGVGIGKVGRVVEGRRGRGL